MLINYKMLIRDTVRGLKDCCCCSVAQSCLTLCDPMDTRLPRPSPTPGARSNSCPLSWWCHPTISSSLTLFSFCLQSSPASGSFLRSQHFTSGGQSFGVSASVLPMNIQDWSPLGWTGWMSFSPRDSQSLPHYHSSEASILRHSAFFIFQLSHPYMTTGKTIALTRWTFVGKVMSLRFNMLSRFVIKLLPRSKYLLISWLQSPSAVILEPKRIKSVRLNFLGLKDASQ